MNDATFRSQYEVFRSRQATLASLIDRATATFSSLDMRVWAESAAQLSLKVQNERFRVMILGEFKRGKSTIINSLLRAEVLPAAVDPCTAVINEVKWGDSARALLHFKQPFPDQMPSMPPDVKRHVDLHRASGTIPPLEVPIADLKEVVCIADPTADQAASVTATPYDRVELFWPLALCKNGVEIIDSPGLNEHHTRTKTTRDYLKHIDAVVFAMTVHHLGSESELAVIDNDLRPSGHESLFFVCNRFDDLRKREDREKIQAFAYHMLANRTRFGREGIFFLSAIDALDGRIEGDSAKVSRSGILPLENALERFLVHDRGRIKLSQPGRNLENGLRAALSDVIPMRRHLLDEDSVSLRQRLDEVQPMLKQAERRRDVVLKQIDAARLRVRDVVRREAERFITNLSQDLPIWAKQTKTESKMPLTPLGRKEAAKRLVDELIAKLQPQVEHSFQSWSEKSLTPLLEQQTAELNVSLQSALDQFSEDLAKIKTKLVGDIRPDQLEKMVGTVRESLVLPGAGGVAIGAGVILATCTKFFLVASTFGITTAITGVGTLILTPLMAHPLLAGAALAGAVVFGQKQAAALTEELKGKAGEQLAAHFRSQSAELSANIADQAHEQTDKLAEEISKGLEIEILQVQEQINAVLHEKDQGEAAVQRQRQALAEQEASLRETQFELNDLLHSLGR